MMIPLRNDTGKFPYGIGEIICACLTSLKVTNPKKEDNTGKKRLVLLVKAMTTII